MRMKRGVFLLVALLPLALAPGCPARHFEIVMDRTADGDVRRELTIWVIEDGKVRAPESDMLTEARAAYGTAGVDAKGKLRFSTTLAADLPTDLVHEGLKNYGFTAHHEAPIGRVFVYVEQMPGQRRPLEIARNGIKFADTLVRALTAYAKRHPEAWGTPEKLEKLIRFLETEFRDDVLTVMLMGWQAFAYSSLLEDASREDEGALEVFAYGEMCRVGSYLAERGYLRADELLTIMEDPGVLCRGVVRKVGVVLGYPPDGPLPAALAGLKNPEEFERVFEDGLTLIGLSREEFDSMLEPFLNFMLPDSTVGTVTWRCKTKPTYTNGAWEADDQELCWDAQGRSGCLRPQVLFAAWATPNEAVQRKHFGSVPVVGDTLLQYVVWREGLTDARRTEWDAFMDTLRPGQKLFERLDRFRFQAPAAAAASSLPTDEPPRGAELIAEGLKLAPP